MNLKCNCIELNWIELNCWQYHGDESSNNVSVTTTTITIQPLLYLSIPTYKKTLHHHHHHHLCIHAQFYLCGITYFCIRIFYVFLCRFLIFLTYIWWWWWPVYFFSLEEGRKEERKKEKSWYYSRFPFYIYKSYQNTQEIFYNNMGKIGIVAMSI